MKLNEIRSVYGSSSTKASDINRYLIYVGILTIWLLREEIDGVHSIPSNYRPAMLLFCLALGVDMMQYIIRAIGWHLFYYFHKYKVQSENEEVKEPEWRNAFSDACWYLKFLITTVAYVLLADCFKLINLNLHIEYSSLFKVMALCTLSAWLIMVCLLLLWYKLTKDKVKNEQPKDMTDNHYRQIIERGIQLGQYPERLYKYRTLESAVQTLEGPSFYASSILNFNDPYEGHFDLDAHNTQQEWEKFLLRETPDMPKAEITKKARILSTHPKDERQIVEPIIHKVLEDTGVYCLSKKWDSIPTWAYYAEDQKGICIEFNPAQDEELCRILLPVNYSDDYVHFNYLNYPQGPKDAILQKAKCWSHEEEYRIIKTDKAGKVIPIEPKAITSIILGCRFFEGIDKDVKRKKLLNKLVEIIDSTRYSHLEIKQCVQMQNKYELYLKVVSLSDLKELAK